jgi:hypothetical protein
MYLLYIYTPPPPRLSGRNTPWSYKSLFFWGNECTHAIPPSHLQDRFYYAILYFRKNAQNCRGPCSCVGQSIDGPGCAYKLVHVV